MRGISTWTGIPSAVSAHAAKSVDIRVCEAQIAITRRENAVTHYCAALSHLPPSATAGSPIARLRLAASNYIHWRAEGGAHPDQIASRSRENILKIPGLRE